MGVRGGEADEGRAASVATECDGFVEPLTSGTFAAYSYETGAETAQCRRTLVVTATRHCFPLCRRRRAHPFQPPHTWRGERKRVSLEWIEEGGANVWLRCTSVELHHPMGYRSGEGSGISSCRSDRIDLCGIGWSAKGPSWRTRARCCRTAEPLDASTKSTAGFRLRSAGMATPSGRKYEEALDTQGVNGRVCEQSSILGWCARTS